MNKQRVRVVFNLIPYLTVIYSWAILCFRMSFGSTGVRRYPDTIIVHKSLTLCHMTVVVRLFVKLN